MEEGEVPQEINEDGGNGNGRWTKRKKEWIIQAKGGLKA
jgi:hypothetical protein